MIWKQVNLLCVQTVEHNFLRSHRLSTLCFYRPSTVGRSQAVKIWTVVEVASGKNHHTTWMALINARNSARDFCKASKVHACVATLASLASLVPKVRRRGRRKSAWYILFAHAPIATKFRGDRVRTYTGDVIQSPCCVPVGVLSEWVLYRTVLGLLVHVARYLKI